MVLRDQTVTENNLLRLARIVRKQVGINSQDTRIETHDCVNDAWIILHSKIGENAHKSVKHATNKLHRQYFGRQSRAKNALPGDKTPQFKIDNPISLFQEVKSAGRAGSKKQTLLDFYVFSRELNPLDSVIIKEMKLRLGGRLSSRMRELSERIKETC